MTVNGKLTGDIVLMNYYDPYQNICPKQVSYIQKFNEHLAEDVRGFGVISDVFSASVVQKLQTRTSAVIPGCVVYFMIYMQPTKATVLWPPLLRRALDISKAFLTSLYKSSLNCKK